MRYGHVSPFQVDVSRDGVMVTVPWPANWITTAAILRHRLLKIGAKNPERLALDLGGLVGGLGFLLAGAAG